MGKLGDGLLASSGVSMFSNNLLEFGLDCRLFGNSVVSLTNNSRGAGNQSSNTVPGARRRVVSSDGAEYCVVTVGVPGLSIPVSNSYLLVIVGSSCVLLVYAEILTNTKLVSFLHIIRVVILVLTLRLLVTTNLLVTSLFKLIR